MWLLRPQPPAWPDSCALCRVLENGDQRWKTRGTKSCTDERTWLCHKKKKASRCQKCSSGAWEEGCSAELGQSWALLGAEMSRDAWGGGGVHLAGL